ncbi:MAG TPA: hypothetical protein VD996_07435 [Chitinophagaceae bacterium]|nr:hypothetical protein [Chitinophagaceae bacterium]
MKKSGWIAMLTLLAAGIMFFLTRPQKYMDTRTGFTRTYRAGMVRVTGFFEAPYDVDILSAWKNTIIGYGLCKKQLLQMDTAGRVLRHMSFSHRHDFGLHSMSYDSNYLYCIDINDHSVYKTDLSDSLLLADTLPLSVMGCVKNPGAGYMVQQFGPASKSAVLRSLHAQRDDTVFLFKPFDDWGVSHRGLLFQNVNASHLFYVPSFNAHGLVYEYATGKLYPLTTVDNNPVSDVSIDGPQGKILSSKAPVINRVAAANSKYLFVLSYARSNEDRVNGIDHPVVDVYAIHGGNYQCSFVIPGIKGVRISGLTCLQDKLVVSFGQKITLLDVNI